MTGAEGADPGQLLAVALAIAQEAGALVAARFGEAHDERRKGHAHNLVTEADTESEALIVGRLRKAFPGHGIVAEEGGTAEGDGSPVLWYVDPLDGTNNFAHGFPVFCVSMAAVAGQDVLCGVSYDPLRDEVFRAARGQGAFLGSRRLRVSRRPLLAESLVATGFPYDKASATDNNLAEFGAVMPQVRGIRRAGSAALDLAYVAAGRLDAYWEHGTRPWDVAAGILLVREAGGVVTDLEGKPPDLDGGRFVASNGAIHDELVATLVGARARSAEAIAPV